MRKSSAVSRSPSRHSCMATTSRVDLKKLDARYSALSAAELQQGLDRFCRVSAGRNGLLRHPGLWDKYLPGWREKISYMEPDNSRIPAKDTRHGEQL